MKAVGKPTLNSYTFWRWNNNLFSKFEKLPFLYGESVILNYQTA